MGLTLSAAQSRGLLAEETQPFLRRHPIVLEQKSANPEEQDTAQNGLENTPIRITQMPPYEPFAPPPPRWVSTSQWPVVAYLGMDRTWPVFIRGHQSALGTYPGILLGPLLEKGIYGPRYITALMGLLIVLLTPLFAFRAGAPKAAAAGAGVLVGLSFGMISIASTSYSFEVASRALMMLALLPLARPSPPSAPRALLSGVLGALAILSRATIGAALLPAVLVLLLRKTGRPPLRTALLPFILMIGLPILIVFGFHWIAPFRAGTAPLSAFPFGEIPGRLLSLPRTALVTLAFLGDAASIWAPLSLGHARLSSSLYAPAFLASLVSISALYRSLRGSAGTLEHLYLWTLLSSIFSGAVLYGSPDQFQLAMALEPWMAAALAVQAADVWVKRDKFLAIPIVLAALSARGHALWEGAKLSAQNKNPMFSAKAQRAAIERMRALGLRGPELLTTVYNHAGVIEAWTGGIDKISNKHDENGIQQDGQVIRPSHAWPVLGGLSESPKHCRHQAAWRALLNDVRPQFVLLSLGPNMFETGATDTEAIVQSLARVAELSGIALQSEGEFPTESGGPGWSLARLVYPAPKDLEFKADAACAEEDAALARMYGYRPGKRVLSFEGLRVGDRFGDVWLKQIIERAEPRQVELLLVNNAIKIVLELRAPGPGGPPPPAQGGAWGVYYRNQDVGVVNTEQLASWADLAAKALSGYQPPIEIPLETALDRPFETDGGIEYVGRFDWSAPRGPRFSFPGTQIRMRIEGSGADIKIAEPKGNNLFFVTVDGGAPRLFHPRAGEHAYTVAEGLSPGIHEIVLYKRTESFWEPVQFLGIAVHGGGRLIAEEEKSETGREKRLEIIGDSISCGYGIEGDSPHCFFSAETESEYDSYGALAARALSARHVNICYSGKGVYRSVKGITTDQMPEIYQRALADEREPRWDFSRYTPDVILINLGTNDFAMGDPGPPFEEVYERFAKRLREIYPKAHLLCAVGPMLGGENRKTALGRIQAVVGARRTEGDNSIEWIEFPQQVYPDGMGCDAHPNRQTHRIAAAVLEKKLRALWEK